MIAFHPLVSEKPHNETQGLNDLSYEVLDREGESSRRAGVILPEFRLGQFPHCRMFKQFTIDTKKRYNKKRSPGIHDFSGKVTHDTVH